MVNVVRNRMRGECLIVGAGVPGSGIPQASPLADICLQLDSRVLRSILVILLRFHEETAFRPAVGAGHELILPDIEKKCVNSLKEIRF